MEQPEDIAIEPQSSGQPKIVQNPLTLFPRWCDVYPGEGNVNSGFLGELNGEPLPGGPACVMTFDTPVEHSYECFLRGSGLEGPGMVGTIWVT